jgi:hypothetical protein
MWRSTFTLALYVSRIRHGHQNESRVVATFTDSRETMDECLDGIHHTTSDGAGIQWDFGHGGSILQVCCLHCDEDALQHKEVAKLFFKHIVKYWGLPLNIVSDRDARFTSKFWTTLFKLVGMKLLKSSSYHP